MVPLCLGSTGAWVNYAMPAVVWGSILLARAASRVIEGPKALGLRALAIPLAAVVVLLANARLTVISATMRSDEAATLGQVLADPLVAATPAGGRYFVGMPQGNRLHGRIELAHDEWLYGSYEALGMAEPRASWLMRALAGPDRSRSVRVVVVPSDEAEGGGHVFGLPATLPELGYRIHQQYGRYAVWVRRDEIAKPE